MRARQATKKHQSQNEHGTQGICLGETLRLAAHAKLLKVLEAGTGIEPVFTDLQSAA